MLPRIRDAGNSLRAHTKAENAAAEGDPADREPGPTQRQTGDHVREPMNVEQYAAGGNSDAEAGSQPRQSSTDGGSSPTPE